MSSMTTASGLSANLTEGVQQEDSAGLEAESETASVGEIKAPFDPADIDVVTQVRTIDLLLSRLREGELELSPDFQRRANLWSDERKSGLVESLLLRIPIPSLYVSEDATGNYAVVDGLQRICAIAHFVDVHALNRSVGSDLSELRLTGLESLADEYNGLVFKRLPRSLQRRILETELTLHVIRASTPRAVKFNIFSRINRGGLPLSAQEIRNAIYPGVWRVVARRLAATDHFRKATECKIRGERMEDIELVLRFLATYCSGADFRRPDDQNLDDFLNDFVESSEKCLTADDWDRAVVAFQRAMLYAPKIFGRHAFRKYYAEGDARRPINRGLFEAQSVVLARVPEGRLHELSHRQPLIMRKLAELMGQDHDFSRSLLYATGRGSSSNVRIEKLTAILEEV